MELNSLKILVVDDEEDIRDYLEYLLQKNGAIVTLAVDGEDAIAKANADLPDVILLDRLMPRKDGIATCNELRQDKKFDATAIIMLSAVGDIERQIEGLEIGANDYLSKPIKSKYLISKIKSHTRNYSTPRWVNNDIIEFKDIRIDRSEFVVQVKNEEMTLPKKEFELLYLLMNKPNYVFRRDEILDLIWGMNLNIGNRTIDVHIRKIREKIGEEFVKTVKGVGYKFVHL